MNKHSIARLISILHRKRQAQLMAELKPLHISSAEIPLLMHLYAHNGVTQDELTVFWEKDKAAIARTVKALTKKGYLTRSRNPLDRRENLVSLTSLALERKAEILGVMEAKNTVMLSGIADSDVQMVCRHLETMIQNLQHAEGEKEQPAKEYLERTNGQ